MMFLEMDTIVGKYSRIKMIFIYSIKTDMLLIFILCSGSYDRRNSAEDIKWFMS